MQGNKSNDDASLSQRVVDSTFWLVAQRWTGRLIGLISTIVLARVLVPEDFGIVATAVLVVAFFDVMVAYAALRTPRGQAPHRQICLLPRHLFLIDKL